MSNGNERSKSDDLLKNPRWIRGYLPFIAFLIPTYLFLHTIIYVTNSVYQGKLSLQIIGMICIIAMFIALEKFFVPLLYDSITTIFISDKKMSPYEIDTLIEKSLLSLNIEYIKSKTNLKKPLFLNFYQGKKDLIASYKIINTNLLIDIEFYPDESSYTAIYVRNAFIKNRDIVNEIKSTFNQLIHQTK